jgi:hypothetical protein
MPYMFGRNWCGEREVGIWQFACHAPQEGIIRRTSVAHIPKEVKDKMGLKNMRVFNTENGKYS